MVHKRTFYVILTGASGILSFDKRDKWHKREFSSFDQISKEGLNLDVQLANWPQLFNRCDSAINMVNLYPVDSAIDLFTYTVAMLNKLDYGMPRGHEHIPFSIYERLSGHFFLKFS